MRIVSVKLIPKKADERKELSPAENGNRYFEIIFKHGYKYLLDGMVKSIALKIWVFEKEIFQTHVQFDPR